MAPHRSLIAIDFEVDDAGEPCSACWLWEGRVVVLADGGRAFREWHHPDCDVALLWAEPDKIEIVRTGVALTRPAVLPA